MTTADFVVIGGGITGTSEFDAIPYIDTDYFDFQYGDAGAQTRGHPGRVLPDYAASDGTVVVTNRWRSPSRNRFITASFSPGFIRPCRSPTR